jgi:hypothetical protein
MVVPDQCFEWRDLLDRGGDAGEMWRRDTKRGRASVQDSSTLSVA